MNFKASHVGLCVSDLDAAMRLYCEGLGFAPLVRYEIGNEYAHTLEVDGDVRLVSQMIGKEGMVVELLAYDSPGVLGTPSANRNQLGLTHLSFIVDDVEAAAARLVEHGATIVESTRTETKTDTGTSELLFLQDLDGTRIELMKLG
jgi:lactoylglutathione lyase